MTKLRCPIDENAQSKFGLKYIKALFRNSKQKTQNVKHDNDEFKNYQLTRIVSNAASNLD